MNGSRLLKSRGHPLKQAEAAARTDVRVSGRLTLTPAVSERCRARARYCRTDGRRRGNRVRSRTRKGPRTCARQGMLLANTYD